MTHTGDKIIKYLKEGKKATASKIARKINSPFMSNYDLVINWLEFLEEQVIVKQEEENGVNYWMIDKIKPIKLPSKKIEPMKIKGGKVKNE